MAGSTADIKRLFRNIPPSQAGFPLASRVRCLVAAHINDDGDSKRALRFLREYPRFAELLHPAEFPPTPAAIRAHQRLAFRTTISVLEYLAASLLPVASMLSRFEHLRDQLHELEPDMAKQQDALADIESAFGYSNWLASQFVGFLPTSSPLQTGVAHAIRDDATYALVALFIQEKYAVSCYSLASSDLAKYLRGKRYPASITSFLLLSLDPTPELTVDEIRSGLEISLGLPAVDRWILLLRSLGAILGSQETLVNSVSELEAVGRLLSQVSSVEGSNIAAAFGLPKPTGLSEPSVLDHALRDFATSLESRTNPHPLWRAFESLSRDREWRATGAVLDRQAVASSGTRLGVILASATAQSSVLSERRAGRSRRWLSLAIHPETKPSLPDGNIARAIRLRGMDAAARNTYSAASDALMLGNVNAAISTLLSESAVPEFLALLLDCYIVTEDSQQAISVASKLIVADSSLQRRVPWTELDHLVPGTPAKSIADGVLRAIVSDACVRHGGASDASKRNDSLDDVLTVSRTRLPSAAAPQLEASGLPLDHISYFLERICTPAIMDTVPVGRSTEELLTERIHVLNLLRALRPERSAEFEAELRAMATVIATRKEMVAVDQQRVYVDVDGLRARLVAQLADDLQRFWRFAKLDPRHQEHSSLVRFLKENFPELTAISIEEATKALASESDAVLARILYQARDEFASGQDFGLDGYLSGGMRHGNLEAHLREPFVNAGMLGTFRDGGSFRAPEMATKLGLVGDPTKVSYCFETFAGRFQAIIDEVLSEWVRVETSSLDTRALFNLTLGTTQFRVLDQRIRSCANVEAAVDEIVRYFLDRVDRCLVEARTRIAGELASRLNEAHTSLVDDLRTTLLPGAAGLILDNLIAPVKGTLDASIGRLTEWFQRPEDRMEGTVEPSIPLEVSATLIQQMFPKTSFSGRTTTSMGVLRIDRSKIKPWVDITHTLLMNAVRHGGEQGGCSSDVALEESFGIVRLTVSNQLGQGARTEDVDDAIQRTRLRLADPKALAAAQAEGGTGLLKILKWSRIDLRCPEARIKLERRDRTFEVTIELPLPFAGIKVGDP